MPITVLCPHCGKRLRAPDSAAGREAKCPKCQELMQLPEADVDEEEVAIEISLKGPHDPSDESTDKNSETTDSITDGRITVDCPSCGKSLQAPGSAVGKQVKCPKCGQVMELLDEDVDAEEVANQPGLEGLHDPPGGSTAEDSEATQSIGGGPLTVNCPSCGKRLRAPGSAAGKQAKCPKCGQVMQLPEAVFDAEEVVEEAGLEGLLGPPGGFSEEAFEDTYPIARNQPSESPFESRSESPSGPQRRPCPSCGEMIVRGAGKCRFCDTVFDPVLKRKAKKKTKRYSSDVDDDLTPSDWLVAMCCSGIGCIVGIVWLIQGKPKGIKMIGASLVFAVLWNILSFMMESALQMPPPP